VGVARSRRRAVRVILRALLLATVGLAAGCIGSESTTVKAEIRDDRIVLAPDHAPSKVRLSLANVGTTRCGLIVLLTSVPANALPLQHGQVAVDESGQSSSPARPALGGDAGLIDVAPARANMRTDGTRFWPLSDRQPQHCATRLPSW